MRDYQGIDTVKSFHRLFLYLRDEPEEPRFEIHIRPDAEQSGAAAERIVIVTCSGLEQLARNLQTLGVNGWSRFIGEREDGPISEFVACSVQDVVAFVKGNPHASSDSLTLIALNSSIPEMRRRIASVLGRNKPAPWACP